MFGLGLSDFLRREEEVDDMPIDLKEDETGEGQVLVMYMVGWKGISWSKGSFPRDWGLRTWDLLFLGCARVSQCQTTRFPLHLSL